MEDPALLDEIENVKSQLASTNAKIKLVERENLHFTLKFLGEIDPGLIEKIYEVLVSISFGPFRIRLGRLGAFPSTSNPRVVWIGVLEGEDELSKIHKQIDERLERLGFRRDREKYVPHLTIARVKGSRNKGELIRKIMELGDIELGEMTVNHIRLKQSILTPKGPIYKTLREVRA